MIFYGKIKKHKEIRNHLLELINTSIAKPLVQHTDYYNDNIKNTDWHNANDMERPWVKKLLPHIMEELLNMTQTAGYNDCELFEIWFQQYGKNSTHGWHIHGRNYTGVYYVEFSGEPKTEIFTNELTEINAEEGDIVMFPSFFIHRAPPVLTDNKKVIVSFNIEFKDILPSKLEKINA